MGLALQAFCAITGQQSPEEDNAANLPLAQEYAIAAAPQGAGAEGGAGVPAVHPVGVAALPGLVVRADVGFSFSSSNFSSFDQEHVEAWIASLASPPNAGADVADQPLWTRQAWWAHHTRGFDAESLTALRDHEGTPDTFTTLLRPAFYGLAKFLLDYLLDYLATPSRLDPTSRQCDFGCVGSSSPTSYPP